MNRRDFIGMGLGAAAVGVVEGCRSAKVEGARCACFGGRPKFRLGMAGYTYKEFKTEEMLRDLERLGIRNLCVKSFHLPLTATGAEIAAFRRQCADHGVTPSGIGPINMKTSEAVKQAFDHAAALGVGTIVAVPYHDGPMKKWGDFEADRAICELCSAKADEYRINVAIHNHGYETLKCFPTGRSVCAYVKDLSPRMGMCLDIGHDLRMGDDPAETIRICADRLFDLHLKDIDLGPDGKQGVARILGRGSIDLPAIVRALSDVGYEGCCSIEYETNFKDNLVDLAESVGYFKALSALICNIHNNTKEKSK